MNRPRPTGQRTKSPSESKKTAVDQLEALRVELGQLDALAHVIGESRDSVLAPTDEESRRRFLRLLGLLTDGCARVYAMVGSAIGR